MSLIATAVLAGCGRAESVPPAPSLSLTPPTPAGMEELVPELVPPPHNTDEDCDLTASLRPFPDRAQAVDAVANIRARGRLIVGLDSEATATSLARTTDQVSLDLHRAHNRTRFCLTHKRSPLQEEPWT